MDEHTEIERRFLVDARREKPWRNGSDRFAIEQHYNVGALLHVHEQALYLNEVHVANLTVGELELLMAVDSWTTRLRKRNEDYVMTYKSRIADDTAYELEWGVSPEVAHRILDNGPFPFVEKSVILCRGVTVLCGKWMSSKGRWPVWYWPRSNYRQAKPKSYCRRGSDKRSRGCAHGQIEPSPRRFQTKTVADTTASMTR